MLSHPDRIRRDVSYINPILDSDSENGVTGAAPKTPDWTFKFRDSQIGTLLTTKQRDEVILSCRLITQYQMPTLQAKAFELLFDLTLPAKQIATMVHGCKVIHSRAEADQLIGLSQSAEKLESQAIELNNSGGTTMGKVSESIEIINKACLESFATITIDLECHLTLVKLLQVKELTAPLACKCLDILGLMSESGQASQEVIARTCVRAVVLPALENNTRSGATGGDTTVQRSAIQCLGKIFYNHQQLCERFAQDICSVIYGVLVKKQDTDIVFWEEMLEFLPVLMARDDLRITYLVCQSIVCQLVCRVVGDLRVPGTENLLFDRELTGNIFRSGSELDENPHVRGYLAVVRVMGIAAIGKLGGK